MMQLFLIALGWIVGLSYAQYQFIVPDPNVTDLTEHWNVGDTMHIEWKAGWSGVGDDPGTTDLWVAWFRGDSFSQLLLPNVTFKTGGNLDWKVNISNDIARTDPQFVLRFKPHSDPPIYTSTENESPSRGFNILPGIEPSSSASSSASSTSTSASTTKPSQSPSATEESSNNNATKKKTNVGAIAGGILGGLVFLIMLCVIALLLLKLAKRKKQEKDNIEGEAAYGMLAVGNRSPPPSEMIASGPTMKYGSMGNQPTELYGREVPQELDGHGYGHPKK